MYLKTWLFTANNVRTNATILPKLVKYLESSLYGIREIFHWPLLRVKAPEPQHRNESVNNVLKFSNRTLAAKLSIRRFSVTAHERLETNRYIQRYHVSITFPSWKSIGLTRAWSRFCRQEMTLLEQQWKKYCTFLSTHIFAFIQLLIRSFRDPPRPHLLIKHVLSNILYKVRFYYYYYDNVLSRRGVEEEGEFEIF